MSTRIMVILMAVLVIVPFYIYFERQKPQPRTIVLLTVLIGLAVAGREAFFMVPFFKPVLAFAVIAGISMGANAGFIVGSMTALVSNFLFGQGPWTVFQMAAWGLVGLVAGLLAENLLSGRLPGGKMMVGKRRIPMMIYGFAAAFLIHGVITDLWTLFFVNENPNLATVLSVYGAALIPDTILGVATAFFLLVLGEPIIGKIQRVKRKYGMECVKEEGESGHEDGYGNKNEEG